MNGLLFGQFRAGAALAAQADWCVLVRIITDGGEPSDQELIDLGLRRKIYVKPY